MKETSPLLEKSPSRDEYFEVFINLFQCTIGVGYVTAAWGFAGASIVGGMAVMGVISYCNYMATDVILRGFKHYDTTDVDDVFLRLPGNQGKWLRSIWNLVIPFVCGLCCVSYNILFGDLGPVFFPSYLNRFTSMILVNVLFVAPMCVIRDLSNFSWTSVLGTLTLFCLLAVYVWVNFREESQHYICWFRLSAANIVQANVVVQLACMNSFVSCMYTSMKRPDTNLFRKVMIHVLWVVAILYPVAGFLGVYFGGPDVQSDFLLDFPSSFLSTTVQWIEIISLIVIFPLINRCNYISVCSFFPRITEYHYFSNIGLVIVYVFIASIVTDLGFVYQLAGAASTLTLTALAPWMLVHSGVVPVSQEYKMRLGVCCIICVFLGFFGLFTGPNNFSDGSYTLIGGSSC